MKLYSFIVMLLTLTTQVAAACRRCHLKDDDGFENCALHLEKLAAYESGAANHATAVQHQAPLIGFQAAMDGQDAYVHVAAAAYLVACTWMDVLRLDSENLAPAYESFISATDHLHAGKELLAGSRKC